MIIIEGIDGSGKSTVASYLEAKGYKTHHLQHDEKTEAGFMRLLRQDKGKLVLDRGFITEVVYGPILRDYSRIDEKALERLILHYKRAETKIIYLKALKEDLITRRFKDKEDYKMLIRYYDMLSQKYDEYMERLSKDFPILTINTSEESLKATKQKVNQFVRR